MSNFPYLPHMVCSHVSMHVHRRSIIESLEDMRNKFMNHHFIRSSHFLGPAQTIRSHPEGGLAMDGRQLDGFLWEALLLWSKRTGFTIVN
jgi:hypothetical protein